MGYIVTESTLQSVQSKMRIAASAGFDARVGTLHYPKLCTVTNEEAKDVSLFMPVNGGSVDIGQAEEGKIEFDRLRDFSFEMTYKHNSRGLRVKHSEFTDSAAGAKMCNQWAQAQGAYAAYIPEYLLWSAVLANPVTQVDSLTFFNTAHLLNPTVSSIGTFKNTWTSGDACPINGATLQTAADNLARAISNCQTVKNSDGFTYGMLKAKYIFVPPQLGGRARQLVGASFLDASDGNPAKSQLEVVEVPELSGAATTYYIGMEEIGGAGDVGAFVYWEREAYTVTYHDTLAEAQRSRLREYEWHAFGRSNLYAGNPRLMHRFPAT